MTGRLRGGVVKLIAFDLETTGRDADSDRIVELCFIELDEALNEKGRWESLVDPGMPIPPEVTEIHGIDDAMVAGAPPFAKVAGRAQKLVDGSVLMAHSHRFDVGFLHNELVRAGQPGISVDHPCIDTLHIERMVNSHRLGEMYKRYTGKELDGAHRSAADTEAMVEVFKRQREVHAGALPDSLEDFVVPRLAKHFDPGATMRTYLDHGRRFYKDEKGVVRFNFGKHRDAPATDHPDYLRWMLKREFPADVQKAVSELLATVEPQQTFQ